MEAKIGDAYERIVYFGVAIREVHSSAKIGIERGEEGTTSGRGLAQARANA